MADGNGSTSGPVQPMLYKGVEVAKKVALPVAALGAVGWASESGLDGGIFKDVWAAVKGTSALGAMVFFLLWLDERSERKKSDLRLFERTMGFTETTNSLSNALDKIASSMSSSRR